MNSTAFVFLIFFIVIALFVLYNIYNAYLNALKNEKVKIKKGGFVDVLKSMAMKLVVYVGVGLILVFLKSDGELDLFINEVLTNEYIHLYFVYTSLKVFTYWLHNDIILPKEYEIYVDLFILIIINGIMRVDFLPINTTNTNIFLFLSIGTLIMIYYNYISKKKNKVNISYIIDSIVYIYIFISLIISNNNDRYSDIGSNTDNSVE